MERRKIVVWDLFGGGCNSFTKMLIDKKIENLYDVFTFDVVPIEGAQIKIKTHHYFNCDLSVGIEKNKNDYEVEYLKNGKIIKCYFHSIFSISDLFSKMLEKNLIKKPDIIISSTLCQSFSNVLSMVGGGTCFWKKEDKKDPNTKLIERTCEEFERLKSGFTKKLNPKKQLFIKRLGQQCVVNTIELIRHFNPKYWYIENPYSSLIWFYIKNNKGLEGYLNKCGLSNYGYPIDKTTGFYSNVKMSLNESRIDKKINTIYLKVLINNKTFYIRKELTISEAEKILKKYDKKEKLLYFSKGLIYDNPSDKRYTANNFYTFWEPITKKMYDDWIKHVNDFKSKGSSGDKRLVKKENGEYFRRWYVEISHSFGEKGHFSLKKTCMTLGKLKNKIKYKNQGEFTTRQLNEATESSHLPSDALYDVFSHFNIIFKKTRKPCLNHLLQTKKTKDLDFFHE